MPIGLSLKLSKFFYSTWVFPLELSAGLRPVGLGTQAQNRRLLVFFGLFGNLVSGRCDVLTGAVDGVARAQEARRSNKDNKAGENNCEALTHGSDLFSRGYACRVRLWGRVLARLESKGGVGKNMKSPQPRNNRYGLPSRHLLGRYPKILSFILRHFGISYVILMELF